MLLFCLLVETEQRAFALYITGIVFVVFSMLTMTESFSSVARDAGGPIVAYGLFAGVFYCANRISYLIVGRMDEALLAQESTISIALLARGYDTPAISRKLYVSQNTVRTHVKKLYVTLGVHSKQDLIELVNKAR